MFFNWNHSTDPLIHLADVMIILAHDVGNSKISGGIFDAQIMCLSLFH